MVDVDLLNVNNHSLPASQGKNMLSDGGLQFKGIRLAETMVAFGSHYQKTELHSMKLILRHSQLGWFF